MGLLQNPLGGLIIAVIGFSLLAVTLIWGMSPSHRDRRAHLFSALVSGGVVFALNMVARGTGVWRWYGYQLPLFVQLGMLFSLPAVLFVAVLAGYRRLAARRQRPFLAYAMIGLLLLVPVTIGGDLLSMSRGTLSFGKGYTIWHDVIVGQVLFWLPVLLYTRFRRIRHPAAA